MNILAKEINSIIEEENFAIFSMLSSVGEKVFFPKGILSQSAEAKEKAHKFNATIGIATKNGKPMCFSGTASYINGIEPVKCMTYAPSYGVLDLRKKWQKNIFEKNKSLSGKKISLPIVTCGITHGLSIIADMWIDPDDVIIVPSMMWGNYNMIFSVRKGAKLSSYQLFTKNGAFNIKGFEEQIKKEALDHDKIMVLLNFPQNPTGYTVTEKEAGAIVEILCNIAEKGKKVIALLDDSYFGLVYEDGVIKESIFAKLACAHKNILAVKADGATKEEFAWGLRVGFITYACNAQNSYEKLYESLEKKTAGCVRGNISNASHLSQTLILNTMNHENYQKEKEENFKILRGRALKIKEILLDEKYKEMGEIYPFNSGYFMCIKVKDGVNAEALRKHLLNKYGVGVIAIGDTDIRVAFSCVEEKDIPELFDIILQGIKELNG
jgi:aspartate/methionine/tyrosine aminotransferase